jgi:predicted protein tyrosine phosphatase
MVLRRHEASAGDNFIVLKNGTNMFLLPKFSHLMMDNRLVQVDIPNQYYKANKEAIDSMAMSTQNFISNLIER